ncbi:hypothetical protein [Simonsiella muelleri]|nr:hypothetical protein [Simonsiella muelleri]
MTTFVEPVLIANVKRIFVPVGPMSCFVVVLANDGFVYRSF